MASSVKKKQLIKTMNQVASGGWRPIGGSAVVFTSGMNALRVGYVGIIIFPSKVIFSRYAGLRNNSNHRIENIEVGYRLISREIMLYLDPDTGEVLRTWDNPYTGETVDVIHVANDPVNGRPNFGYGRDGKVAQLPIKMVGDYWQMNLEIPLCYHNILGGNFQKYVGGSYHASELFN